MDLLKDRDELKLIESIFRKIIKKIMKEKKMTSLTKLKRHKKKTLKMQCFMKEESGFDSTCRRMV